MELKFTQEVKDRWVAALRSGNYEQGKGQLELTRSAHNVTQYCCLGVLKKVLKIGSSSSLYLKNSRQEYYILTEEQQAILGYMNDHHCSFDHVAGYITAAIEAQP